MPDLSPHVPIRWTTMPGAQPLLDAAQAELHTQIATLEPDAKAAFMGGVDFHGNGKLVFVVRGPHGWDAIVTGQRYDGALSGVAGVRKVWR